MKKILAAALGAAALALPLAVAGPASAATTYDPNVTRIANPANVCKSIIGSVPLVTAGFGLPDADLSSFSYVDCVTMLAKGEAVVEPVDQFGDPYKQCAELAAMFPIYGSVLHSGEGGEEDAFLPDLKVNNNKQCGSALYAYHEILTLAFGG